MHRFLRVFLLTLLCCAFLAGGAFAWVYNPATGHYYDKTVTVDNWGPCEAEAVIKGGHLVTINDAAEEIWLRSTFGTDNFWIGFTDKDQEGHWVWIAGDGGWWEKGNTNSTSYVNWGPGEPNNATPPAWGEDYAVMNWYSKGKWNDYDSERPEKLKFYGIIEVVPVPPSLLLLASGLAVLWRWRRD